MEGERNGPGGCQEENGPRRGGNSAKGVWTQTATSSVCNRREWRDRGNALHSVAGGSGWRPYEGGVCRRR